jgi:abelson tyrosine-protein kinase 1
VLVNIDRGQPRYILSDFGQSEMKSEVYRLSGDPLHRAPFPFFPLLLTDPGFTGGTLRWQAPEIMNGHNQHLTMETDVYAFAITCVEILTKGNLPWTVMDDDDVRHLVLSRYPFRPFLFSPSNVLCPQSKTRVRPSLISLSLRLPLAT